MQSFFVSVSLTVESTFNGYLSLLNSELFSQSNISSFNASASVSCRQIFFAIILEYYLYTFIEEVLCLDPIHNFQFHFTLYTFSSIYLHTEFICCSSKIAMYIHHLHIFKVLGNQMRFFGCWSFTFYLSMNVHIYYQDIDMCGHILPLYYMKYIIGAIYLKF